MSNFKIVISYILFMAFSLFVAETALAAPNVLEVVGSVFDSQTLTVTGNGFGTTGPSIVVFDDFNDEVVGAGANLTATVGGWTESEAPVLDADGENVAVRLVDGLNSEQLRVAFPPAQELFLSYRIKIPSGYHFPNTENSGDFAPDSAWKQAWVFDTSTYDGYTGDDDICLPSWSDGTRFTVGGNDNAFPATAENGWDYTRVGQPGQESNWFSFAGWNRVSSWLKAGATPEVDNGVIWFSGLSSEFGQKTFQWLNRVLFDGDDGAYDNAVSQWTQLNLSGWHRTGGANSTYDVTTRAIYDDIYLATGPNAAARVEIGNAATYGACTKLAIATPISWSDTSIAVTVRGGGFAAEESAYLFVVDANNNPSTGFSITVGENYTPVEPPQNLKVL